MYCKTEWAFIEALICDPSVQCSSAVIFTTETSLLLHWDSAGEQNAVDTLRSKTHNEQQAQSLSLISPPHTHTQTHTQTHKHTHDTHTHTHTHTHIHTH